MTSDLLMDLQFQEEKSILVDGGKMDHVDAIKIRNLTTGALKSAGLGIFLIL